MNNWFEQNKALILVSLVFMTLLAIGFIYTRPPEPEAVVLLEPSPTLTPTPSVTPTPPPLRVYISGEVQNPDVYFLPPGSIIEDGLALAGGPTEQADLRAVNLALELKDQQQINTPNLAQNLLTPPIIRDGVAPPVRSLEAAHSAQGQSGPQAGETPDSPAPSAKININTADLATLDQLPGVGPAIAQRIIDYREAKGSFRTLEEIMAVRGIGPVTFEKMKG